MPRFSFADRTHQDKRQASCRQSKAAYPKPKEEGGRKATFLFHFFNQRNEKTHHSTPPRLHHFPKPYLLPCQTIRFTAQNVWFWSAKGNLIITLHATSTYENGTKRGQKRPISTQADCQANARGAPSPYQNLLQTQAANHRHRTKAARMRNGVYGVWRPFRKNFYFFLCRKKKNK